MHRVVLSSKPDQILLFSLLLHLTFGWIFVNRYGGAAYFLIGSLLIVVGFIIKEGFQSLWVKTQKYHRYALLMCLLCFSWYFHNILSYPYLLMHMTMVMLLSALYFVPFLVWMVAGWYMIYFIILESYGILYKEYDNVLLFTLVFVLIVAFILHKVCSISLENMTLIQKVEREQNFERIGQQQHLATIGQIAASIAHDIRNPLTSIQGFVQLIEKNERRSGYQEYFHIIRSEITRIDTLLREVLMLSKSHTVDADSMELVKLDLLLERLVLLMDPDAIKCNIQIRLHIKHRPAIMGSEEKLQQVFMNLLRNALEAVAENGRIDIILTQEEKDAVVRILDTGAGIPADKMEHLFTPFFTTKSEGTGLGLSICHSIISAYDGKIQARNLPERGAEFMIVLPISMKDLFEYIL